jgi:hypothetical protein
MSLSQFISGASLCYTWTSQAVSTENLGVSSYDTLVEAYIVAVRAEILQHIRGDLPNSVPLTEITANYRSLVEEVQGYCLNVPISFATYSSLHGSPRAVPPLHGYSESKNIAHCYVCSPL